MGARQGTEDLLAPDAVISTVAARHHGVLTRAQLRGLGIGRRVIERRLAIGRLERVHLSVYAVGGAPLGARGRWMAAVLAGGGGGGTLGCGSAAALWAIRASASSIADVIVNHGTPGPPGVRRHRIHLDPSEVTTVDSIPVTTVARTLLDLARILPGGAVHRAAREAETLGILDHDDLRAVAQRHFGARGAPAMRELVEHYDIGLAPTRSELEDRFLSLLAVAGLPPPRVNGSVRAGGRVFEVDCAWADRGLIVELDGHAWHGGRDAFESDRSRDRVLARAGWRVVRVTWRHLRDEPESVLSDLRMLLA
ncbi:MAG: type IV toxin-antitoxin system AbiEi family antitoxin domain-containing protein [Solirubrobacterales bacterium]